MTEIKSDDLGDAYEPPITDEVNEIEEGEAPAQATPGKPVPLAKQGQTPARLIGPCPNKPSFDHTGGKSPKPRLRKGEKVLHEKTVHQNNSHGHGVKLVITSESRWIYLCSLDEYQNKIAPLMGSRRVYEYWFPQAV